MDDPYWYKNAIIYAVDIEKFYDSDGDGIGDLRGATEKLPYLADLGVTLIWLLPIYRSPRRDNGYDISDYFSIDPRLGTFDDFLGFIRSAGELGMRVMMDLIVNHTSNEHPWFQASRHDADSGYRDYYVWSSAPPPPSPESKTIFPGAEDSVWTFDEVAQRYYFHRFYHFQPELNLRNERVRSAIRDIVDYWLSFGVAGLRLDAAVPMIHEKGQPGTIPADPHQTLRELYHFLQQRKPGSVLLGEVDTAPENITSFFDEHIQMNLFFNFYLTNHLFLGIATESASAIERALETLPPLPPECGWTNFLRNLDELDLEQLDPGERETVLDIFAPDQEMRIYGRGLRRRLAPMMNGDQRRIKMVFSLLFSLPGAPMIVYGDEIGMGEDLSQPGRQSVRTPMQWTSARNGGFSTAKKNDLVTPVIEDGIFGTTKVNADAQFHDDDSLRAQIRDLCAIRRQHSAVSENAPRPMATGGSSVLCFSYNLGDSHLVIVHNLAGEAKSAQLGPIGAGAGRLRQLTGPRCEMEPDSKKLNLPPFGFGWFVTETL